MPKLKPVVLKDKTGKDGTTNIKIRLTHDGRSREISTPWYIKPGLMNRDGTVNKKYLGHSKLNMAINLLLAKYNSIIAEIGADVMFMDINALTGKLRGQSTHGASFSSYMDHRISDLIKERRFSYAESYSVTLKHLKDFTGRVDLQFKEITISFLRDFEAYLKLVRSARINTMRIYLNNIRSVLYHAIDNEIIRPESFPFRKFKVQQEQSRKRSLDIEDLKKLIVSRPALPRGQQCAVDIFSLVFYLIGINLKDLLYLKPESIYKGRINYRRFKTGREYSIRILSPAMEIIKKYKGKKYLLRFLEEKERITPKEKLNTEYYKDILNNTNKHLRIIAKKIKLPVKLSTYYARHSWATIAAGLGISRDIISHALGHGIDTITDIYIDFNQDLVDEANEKVIAAIL